MADALEAIDRDPAAAFRAVGMRAGAPSRRRSPGARCASRGGCTCCWRRTGSRIWPAGFMPNMARTRIGSCSERPYELTRVFGVGFLIADRIARAVGAAARGANAPAPARCTC